MPLIAALCAAAVLAFCTSAAAGHLDLIQDENLEQYTATELSRGAPTLGVSSRALYREALEALEAGDRERAVGRLRLAADLSGDDADPLFTLARIEASRFDPAFLPHLVEAVRRLAGDFRSQSFLAANTLLVVAASFFGGLLVALVALLARSWPLVDHWFRERHPASIAVPPAGWIGGIALLGLLAMRLGLALYAAILFVVVWMAVSRRERFALAAAALVVAGISLVAGRAGPIAAGIDPASVTSRLALVNERGADERTLAAIESIRDDRFAAERAFAIGTLRYRAGEFEEAKKLLLEAVAAESGLAAAYLNLGNVYFCESDYDRALAGYQNALAIDSTNVLAHYNIGQAYIRMMLFAQSSDALERASEFGVEGYRATHASARIRNLTIYEAGFRASDLWRIAIREGEEIGGGALTAALRPWLLLPFDRLWIVLVAALLAAMTLRGRFPSAWRVFRCENCGRATCEICAGTNLGIALCPDCAGVVGGLSSVKVMEALLRHRRQKRASARSNAMRLARFFWPGAAAIIGGRTRSGILGAAVAIAALMLLAWRGPFFRDPRSIDVYTPIWMAALPAAILLFGWLAAARRRRPEEPRNYRILPPDVRVEADGREDTGRRPAESRPEAAAPEPLDAFLDSL
ncbi:MAG: tetratricopeptide repeat protein [Candidatus Krumholzibacteriota bacterium]|nr:tetratricopeptide repeat protein [Candidatus Krumholzibacteriota bacterium]